MSGHVAPTKYFGVNTATKMLGWMETVFHCGVLKSFIAKECKIT